MSTFGKQAVRTGIATTLAFGAAVAAGGCTPPEEGTEMISAAQLTENGLTLNGLTLNGLTLNGLTLNGLTLNGLTLNGLSSVNGLSSTNGLMTTSGGRDIVKYLVKCAYPVGHSLVKTDQNGMTYTFAGSLGVAPEMETSGCGLDCQEKVSACVLAHVNNAGVHVSLWMVGPDPGIGWGSSTDYPYQEGSFFGNLFPVNWTGYYCSGKDWDTAAVPGRLGSPITTNVYVDPYGTNVPCQTTCTVTNQGYSSCPDVAPTAPYASGHRWNHVITVWRNFDTNTSYKICNYYMGGTKCLGIAGGSVTDGAAAEIRTYSGAASMQWKVLQVATGRYELVNVASGKALDRDGAGKIIQKTYAGTPGQQIAVASLSVSGQYGRYSLTPSSGTTVMGVNTSTDGATVQLTSNSTSDMAKWTMVPAGAQ
jgi:hypothetical protein